MDSSKSKIIVILLLIILVICIYFAINKNSVQVNPEVKNEIGKTEIVKVETEDKNGTKDVQYHVQDENGNTIISYDEEYIVTEDSNGKVVYEIKDKDGRTIGTTEDKDEIRLYIDNPTYGEYAPTITE